MSEGLPYADIILLALIAGFILLRLRSVLGRKTGRDDMQMFTRAPLAEAREQPIVQVEKARPRPKEENDPALAAVTDENILKAVAAIKAKDPQFTVTSFLGGAKLAFEMAFDAFAKGDRNALKLLLSDTLFKHFEGELAAREKEPKKIETTLVAVTSRDIAQAALTGNTARVTVKFTSDQVSVVRDAEGKIIEGDPSDINRVEDEWAFERDVASKNPNWKIVET